MTLRSHTPNWVYLYQTLASLAILGA